MDDHRRRDGGQLDGFPERGTGRRAAARFAVTASPAPTTSIGPRSGSAGTCSDRASGAAPTMPCSASVTKTGRPLRRARAGAAILTSLRSTWSRRVSSRVGQLGRVHLEAQPRPAGQACAANRPGSAGRAGRRPGSPMSSSRPRVITPVSAWSTCSSTIDRIHLGGDLAEPLGQTLGDRGSGSASSSWSRAGSARRARGRARRPAACST